MELTQRVLNNSEGKEVAMVEVPETATQIDHEGKIYRRKETGSGRLSEDFYETGEPGATGSPLLGNKP